MNRTYWLLGGALLLTLLSEGLLAFLVKKQKSWVWLSVSCNLITNPVVNLLVFYARTHFRENNAVYLVFVCLLEIAVVCLEAWIYRRGTGEEAKPCFLFSVEANALSFGMGLLISRLIQ